MRGEGAVLDDRYELGAVLGRGGSAVVHRAWDRERGRQVAVKLLPPAEGRPGTGEAAILGGLDHPQLVALHDVLDTAAGTALVMELVDGPSLHDLLEQRRPDPAEVLVVLRDVAAGLAHAHRRGVVHRDVKPGNVLLRLAAGRVDVAKLSDFGIARRADATRTTAERTVVGTVRFLSPEQVRGERATGASDVYSLGLTVLAALTGEEAFPGRETETLAGRLLRPPPIPATLPEDWADLLRGMTALDPEERSDASTVAALACSLGAADAVPLPSRDAASAATRPIDVPVRATVRRPHRRRLAGAIAGTAVAGVVLGGLVAAVLAPTALRQAAAGPVPAASGSAPAGAAVASPPVPAAVPATAPSAAPAPAALSGTEDHGGRHGGSGRASRHGGED